jgi:GNAT superfamily N-acetyltransferase
VKYHIREATVADAPVLARQRRAMFAAMAMLGDPAGAGNNDHTAGDELEQVCRQWIARELAAGTFFSWVVEVVEEADGAAAEQYGIKGHVEAAVVAGGGLQLRPLMPRPGHLRGEPEALILSMWTEPAHRRRGLAALVVETMLAWCRARGIRRVTLHASEMGRPIYERLGFRATNEMRLEL